jgi:hypothetical protein
VPSTGNTGQSGPGDIQEKFTDLEHQFRRLTGDFALCAAHFKGNLHAVRSNYPKVVNIRAPIWAHVRKIETHFHWAQGDYHVRISKMQAVTARCKRQVQVSSVSRYSGVNTGGSLSAPRY